MLNNRLQRLEKRIAQLAVRACRVCHGRPVAAAIREVYEIDPNGPGFRPTGERHLLHRDDRLTADLRCTACGQEAPQLHLMHIAGTCDPHKAPE